MTSQNRGERQTAWERLRQDELARRQSGKPRRRPANPAFTVEQRRRLVDDELDEHVRAVLALDLRGVRSWPTRTEWI